MRILLITTEAPWPPTSGGRQRTNLLYRALSCLGEVDTLCIRDPSSISPRDAKMLETNFGLLGCKAALLRGEHFPWNLFRWCSPALVDRIAHNFGGKGAEFSPQQQLQSWFRDTIDIEDYDLVVGRYISSLAKLGILGERNTMLDIDDFPSTPYELRLASSHTPAWQRPVLKKHLSQLTKKVPELVSQPEGLWVSSESDRERHGLSSATWLPNICWFPDGEPPESLRQIASNIILIVGTWDYTPNAHGLDYFLGEVWPLVLRHVPAAELKVVGAKISAGQESRWSANRNVNVAGFADSLVEEYRKCAITIAPILYGGGTNIKVIESLSYGRICVASMEAARGFEKLAGPSGALLVGASPKAFAAQCVQMLGDTSLRETIVNESKSAILAHYSFSVFKERVRSAVAEVLS